MNKSAHILSLLLVLLARHPLTAADIVWFDGKHPITYSISTQVDPVVMTALAMWQEDMRQVTGFQPQPSATATIRIVQGNRGNDGFRIYIHRKQLVVEGNSGRGTAYAVLELSRLAGVSPWVWWGDVVPEQKKRLTLPKDFHTTQVPNVEYRGIFINDEDWSIRPWSYTCHEPAEKGTIGVQTYKRVFQLLLRLRANAVWPAMHPGTLPFFLLPGAKAMADSFGIVIGTSHCEPMLRNNVGEWDVAVRGRFNYKDNRRAVHEYWIERLKEVSGSANNMFTIGMRGIHDSSMEGYQGEQEKFEALQQVIDDQQELLRRYVGNPDSLMQVFVPYKEVLQLYEKGLKVPESVTLMWCDDNYGYITRLSDKEEQLRRGGAGVYYHLSYWGRPHDYLWLTTTQPGLIYHEMRKAYDCHARKLWIVNVHDPKVAGYDLELFLDMAWNIESVSAATLGRHYEDWLCRQFGTQVGRQLYPVMHEFYRLCGQRRPEFMGWSQTELDKGVFDRGLSPVRNSEFSLTEFGGELDRYLDSYAKIADEVAQMAQMVRPERRDAYFAAIQYPVEAAAAHAIKILESQKSRMLANGSTLRDTVADRQILVAVAKSQQAYKKITRLTDYYNLQMTGGKWRNLMNDRPRDLPVFWAPLTPFQLADDKVSAVLSAQTIVPKDHPVDIEPDVIVRDAADCQQATPGCETVQMLGHSMRAVSLPKKGSVSYRFDIAEAGDYLLTLALIPTQPVDGGDLRFCVAIDDGETVTFSLKEPFRSEQWKLNVLRGQALRTKKVALAEGSHTLTITAIDENIVVDQWMLDPKNDRRFYLIPTVSDIMH